MDKFAEQMAEIIKQLQAAAPDVQQAILGTVLMQAISTLALAVLWLIFGVCAAISAYFYLYPRFKQARNILNAAKAADRYSIAFYNAQEVAFGWGAATFAAGVIATVIIVATLNVALDPATYIAIKHPEYLIVQKILHR